VSPALEKLYAAHLAARSISLDLYAAYWSRGQREYLKAQAHKEFSVLAAALGYRIEKIEAVADDEVEE
jgi:hypothetical protein